MLLRNIYRGIVRHPKKSAAVFLTVLVLSLAFMLFARGIEQMARELSALAEKTPVEVEITNLTGTSGSVLAIREEKLAPFMDSGLVEPVLLTAQGVVSDYKLAEEKVNSAGSMEFFAAGITAAGLGAPQYLEGFSEDLFAGDESVCLMQESYLQEKNLQVGGTYTAYLHTYTTRSYKATAYLIGKVDLKIVGTYQDIENPALSGAQFLLPYNTLKKLTLESGRAFISTAAKFRVKDPEQLNGVKNALREAGFKEIDQATMSWSEFGDQAMVRDGVYVTTAEPLKRNLKVMESFYPLIALVIALTGLLVSGLTVRDRREETAIQLSLGASRAGIFFALTGELLALTLAGTLLGAALVALFTGIGFLVFLPQIALLLGAYLLGSVVWVLVQAGMSPMVLLKQTD